MLVDLFSNYVSAHFRERLRCLKEGSCEHMSSEAYRQAGVDIDAGNALVEAIKPAAKASARPGVMAGLGGFGALFDLKQTGYQDPLLVAATDGVGTKLRVAIEAEVFDTLGQDLVAMCVNDLVVQGAEPLFFLDYFASAKLDVAAATTLIEGIARACQASGCALIGGETAEMPGLYQPGDFDLAGFAVGAVERDAVLPKMEALKAGDKIIALPSSGLHSNGFSLVRKLVEEAGYDMRVACPDALQDASRSFASLGQALLTPTQLYVKSCLAACKTGQVKALSHITGGGLIENIPRVLPDGLGVRLDAQAWHIPSVFTWLASLAPAMSERDWLTTFNCGVGMVLMVEAASVDAVQAALADADQPSSVIGEVTPQPSVVVEGFLQRLTA